MHQNYHIALLNYGSFYAYVRIQIVEQEKERQVEQASVEDNTNIVVIKASPGASHSILYF
jgi:arginine repressor